MGTERLARLAVFFRQLYVLTNGGVPLARGLEVLAGSSWGKALDPALHAVTRRVMAGARPSDAFAQHPGVFPPEIVGLVRVGESTGSLISVLDRGAELLEHRADDLRRLTSALIYPAFVLGMALLMLLGMALFFVPRLVEVLASLQQSPSWFVKLGGLVSDPMVLLVGAEGLALLGFAAYRWSRTAVGRLWLETMMLDLPVGGPITRLTHEAHVAYSLSLMLRCGMGTPQALKLLGQTVPMRTFRETLSRVNARVVDGLSLGDAFATEGTYSSMFCSMISVGEESGRLPVLLQKCHSLIREDLRLRTEQLTALVEPFVTVLLGGVIGAMALAMYGPLAQVLRSL